MLEKVIETECTKYAKEKGWLVYKGNAPGRAGFHDRIHFKGGVCFTLEYKAPGKKASTLQRKRAGELSKAGIPCRCIDSLRGGREFIDFMTELAKVKTFSREMLLSVAENTESFD